MVRGQYVPVHAYSVTISLRWVNYLMDYIVVPWKLLGFVCIRVFFIHCCFFLFRMVILKDARALTIIMVLDHCKIVSRKIVYSR
jgi:hypothetical protein